MIIWVGKGDVKRYKARFSDTQQVVEFGAHGREYFVETCNVEARKLWRARHPGRNKKVDRSAEALEYHLLNGPSVLLYKNIQRYQLKLKVHESL